MPKLDIDSWQLEPLELTSFTLTELGTPLAEHSEERRRAYAEAARIDGAFTVALPEPWRRIIGGMVERGHQVASRYLDADGGLKEELDDFNDGFDTALGPVWCADRTRTEDPDAFLPQRGLFVRQEKLWDVYADGELVLGFLLKLFIRTQALCRHLELLEIPPSLWLEATGGAVDAAWPELAPELHTTLDALATERFGAEERADWNAEAWQQKVRDASERMLADCRCWHWSSLNFYLYNDGIDLERIHVQELEDRSGEPGYAASLLVEHADYDLLASVTTTGTGLQARDRDGRWHSVAPDQLLINTGKTMQLLSGGTYEDGEVHGGTVRAIPHRVVVQGTSREAVRRQLEKLQRRISIVGVTEPQGDEARLLTWNAEAARLEPVAGLEHCTFWQFLVRKVPPVPAA